MPQEVPRKRPGHPGPLTVQVKEKQMEAQQSMYDAGTLLGMTTLPRYDRSELACGIAHIGVGNFHRSHQALFLHEYLQNHPEENWMIHGIGPLDSDLDLIRVMNSQDNLYTLTERSGSQDTLKVVGSIKRLSHAPSDPQSAIQLLASSDIKIVSLTITEKGYCYNSAGDLDVDHPMIRADLRKGVMPKSVLGYLFHAAEQRMLNNGAPFTIVSCDNIPANGNMTRRILLQLADLKEPAVGQWIRDNTAFPNCMVDRITPAVTDKTRAFVRDTFGVDDKCPVVSESYLQWILEDEFINGRPQLETVGVQFTHDVEPYEKLKVRMLNGSHSALAYVAYLMGFRNVDEAMNDRLVRMFVQRYMDEDITPTLLEVPGVDVTAYKHTLIQRFSNSAISDQVQRLAMDGSQKIPNFLVPPLEHQLASGGSIKWMAFALAAWYRYLRGVDESGVAIEIVDPMKEELVSRARIGGKEAMHLLSVQEIFGQHVSADSRVVTAMQDCLDKIYRVGTRQALRQLLDLE